MQEPEEEGSRGDGGGGGLTWQQNTQIVELSFEAYRHGRSRAHAELNLPYLQLHTTPVCRLLFGSLLQKKNKKKTHKDCRSHRLGTIIKLGTCGVLRASLVSVQSRCTQCLFRPNTLSSASGLCSEWKCSVCTWYVCVLEVRTQELPLGYANMRMRAEVCV